LENLTPQPPSHLSLALPYKGREKEKLLFWEGRARLPSPKRRGAGGGVRPLGN